MRRSGRRPRGLKRRLNEKRRCAWSAGTARMQPPVDASAARHDQIVAAISWCALSVAWALLVAVTSLAAGFAADSTALVGFGLASLVDGTASSILVRRFRRERLDLRPSDELERRAAQAIGVIMFLIAGYLAVRAIGALADGSGPESSALGVVLTGASILALPVLAVAKLRLAGPLESQALRADGVISAAGAVLAAATLVGLVLNTTLDLWWADSVAALMIAAVLMREGGLTLRSVRTP
jgi:divalent metal cation (Fe/Co/Zn/Cd) transporter